MNLENFKKKILYKATNRGWKETDILLGEFTKKNIESFSIDELKMLDNLLDEADAEIFEWVTNKKNPPKIFDNKIMRMLKQYAE